MSTGIYKDVVEALGIKEVPREEAHGFLKKADEITREIRRRRRELIRSFVKPSTQTAS